MWYNEDRFLLSSGNTGILPEHITSPMLRRLATMNTLPPHAQKSNHFVTEPQDIIEFDVDASHHKNRRGTTMVVYALVDPRDSNVRYIGITNNLLERFNEHVKLRGNNKRKHVWLREILDAHMLPWMITLEVVDAGISAREREIAYIQAYTQTGIILLNDEVQQLAESKKPVSIIEDDSNKTSSNVEGK